MWLKKYNNAVHFEDFSDILGDGEGEQREVPSPVEKPSRSCLSSVSDSSQGKSRRGLNVTFAEGLAVGEGDNLPPPLFHLGNRLPPPVVKV